MHEQFLTPFGLFEATASQVRHNVYNVTILARGIRYYCPVSAADAEDAAQEAIQIVMQHLQPFWAE